MKLGLVIHYIWTLTPVLLFFIDVGSSFQILAPWYRKDLKPFHVVFTIGCINMIPPRVSYCESNLLNMSMV